MENADKGTGKLHVYKVMDSPVGSLTLIATDDGLAAILWPDDRPGRVRIAVDREDASHPVLREAERQLREYFAGQRKQFTVPLDVTGTAFQRDVWNALLTIPFGETRSVRRDCAADWEAPGSPCRRCRQRPESPLNHRAVPSGHRIRRRTHRVCRRPGDQGTAAGPRGSGCRVELIGRLGLIFPITVELRHRGI